MSTTLAVSSNARSRARDILAKESAFSRCSPAVIDAIVERSTLLSFKRDEYVYRQGEPGDNMMILISGQLKTSSVTEETGEFVLGYQKPGSVIGEIAVIDGGPRTANVTAVEPSEAVAIYRRDLLMIIGGNPLAMFGLLEGLCDRLRRTNALFEGHGLDSDTTIAACLNRLMRDRGKATPEGTAVEIKVTQSDLSCFLGLPRETVSRALSELMVANLIETTATSIKVIDLKGLAAAADR